MSLTSRRNLRSRIIIASSFLAVFGTACALYLVQSDAPDTSSSNPTTKPPVVATEQKSSVDATFGLPTRLQIQKIKVDAAISYTGLTDAGEMEVPPDLINVGWYKYGTKPGNVGSAVIAGHLEGTKDKGVFIGLDKLQPGDLVNVRNDRNETVAFVVRETRSYMQHERPAEIFNKSDGIYLNLITCSGVWSESQQRYSHRFVVFTEKV